MSAENPLSSRQRDDLAVIAAMMIPASSQYDVPGADDTAIQADIVATCGRDAAVVAQALDQLASLEPGGLSSSSTPCGARRSQGNFARPAAARRQRSCELCCSAIIATTALCARWALS